MAALTHIPQLHKRVVGGLLVRQGCALLCLRRGDRPWHPAVWDLPGGHVKQGESVTQALSRELFEELGVTVAVFGARYDAEISGGSITVFTLRDWQGEPTNAADEEHDAIDWFTADEIQTLCLSDDRLATLIKQTLDGDKAEADGFRRGDRARPRPPRGEPGAQERIRDEEPS